MLLGFKPRFAAFVEEGTKQHTIRPKRRWRGRVGETCHCYVNPRQKTMRLLGRWECVRIEEIQISFLQTRNEVNGQIWIEGVMLAPDEQNAFAWRDGFRSRGPESAFSEMLEHWLGKNPELRSMKPGESYSFEGDIIHWRYAAAKGVAA